jgi:hypothetical protein
MWKVVTIVGGAGPQRCRQYGHGSGRQITYWLFGGAIGHPLQSDMPGRQGAGLVEAQDVDTPERLYRPRVADKCPAFCEPVRGRKLSDSGE